MIPLHLRISGFLSYLDPVELDFNLFDLACISGHNGAGKSSLLDAMTWSLFGEARGKSSDVINLSQEVKAAEVIFTFTHEKNVYRVQRTLPRGKSTVLEFQVLDQGHAHPSPLPQGEGVWRTLTEKTTRDTQARIENTLRLDYETFINASFFLQGKADQFTQQNASKRKDVLSNILGLEVWEQYKQRTAEKRKTIEHEVDEIDGRMAEIDAELAEESPRRNRLEELHRSLKQVAAAREAQESALESIRRSAALIAEQRKLTATLSAGLERSRAALTSLSARLAAKDSERASYSDLISRAAEIEATYQAWQQARHEVEAFDKLAGEFREHEKERAPLLERIAAEKARLEEELRSLRAEETEVNEQRSANSETDSEIAQAQEQLADAEARIAERASLEAQRNAARERQAALKVENETLKADMNQLKERIESLKSADGATCPLCGQDLSDEHRKTTLNQLEVDGKEKGDRYRTNVEVSKTLAQEITTFESQVARLASAETDRVRCASLISQLTERMERVNDLTKNWEADGKKRLKAVVKALEDGKFAADEQKRLAKLDKELAKLGYDTAAHAATRTRENELRTAEEEHVNLRSARDVNRQIESEIESLREESQKRQAEFDVQQEEYESALRLLQETETQAPNLDAAEREVFRLREEENSLRAELGGAQQRVDILATQRARRADFEKERETLQRRIAQHRTLEQAFGRNGVPALLIEQALPQIEDKANDLLDRLSGGGMSIRFVTQAEYRDKKRDDLKETLDIQISDSAGTRAYEMYSGGEAFRVNFAIRLALSEILAQRKGARLQTLVIDEGFGSQDVQGRQRLIEAINLVKHDFAKILVITHLEELKEAFPSRIEIEKTDRGSAIRVM